MTSRLNPMHPLDALYSACQRYPGGIEALAARLGSTRAVMYNKLRQQVDTHRVGFSDELTRILHVLQDAGVPDWSAALHALCWQHGHVAVSLPDELELADEDVLDVLTGLIGSLGEVATRLRQWRDARAGQRHVPSHQVQALHQQIQAAMVQLVLLDERLTDDFSARDDLDAALARGRR